MGNFTESQILTLTLIAASNVILIVVAFILLFSGKKSEKKVSGTNTIKIERPIEKPVVEEIEEIVEEPEIEDIEEEIKYPEAVSPRPRYEQQEIKYPEAVSPRPRYEQQEIKYPEAVSPRPRYEQQEIDYNNYKIDEYSDEEYKYSSIEEFENQQEENAIISYNELMKFKEDYEEPKEEYVEPAPRKNYSNSNYGQQDFISPVFGRIKNDYDYVNPTPKRVERKSEIRYNNAPVREVAKKIDSNTEFLNALKEFRNNL